MTDREAFEKWITLRLDPANIEKISDGSYAYMRAFVGWEVWQASRQATIDELTELLKGKSEIALHTIRTLANKGE